ncbi:MAG: ABC transporter ATP-binding protein [Lachnospiraceae bacterium]|nr:ABC transporter ATP-binding protein [Lachnospiraceae bacterium]
MRKKTLRQIFKYIKANTVLLIISLFCALLSVVGTLYLPILIGKGVDLCLGTGLVDFKAIGQLLVIGIIVIAITMTAQFIMNLCNNRMTANVVARMRKDAIRKLQKLPIRYIDNKSYGELVNRIIADVDTFSEGLLLGFTQLFTGILTILGTLGFMLVIDVKITLIVVLVTPLSFFVAGFVSKKTFNLFTKQSSTRGEQTAYIEEMVGNQKIVRAFGKEADTMKRFDEINGKLQNVSVKAIFFSSLTNPATRFINALVYAAVGVFGAIIVMDVDTAITVGELSCFLSYANQYTKPFNEISGVIAEFQNALACAENFFKFLSEEDEKDAVSIDSFVKVGQKEKQDREEYADKEAAESETRYAITNGAKLIGDVTIKNVSFSYVPERKLIEGFNLHVKQGQRVAIVGPTGCGKTTLINLLMRFYDINAGDIILDGVPIDEQSRHDLRDSYGMVLQETWLKNGTIRENIAFGNPDASMEEIEEAAKKAHAHSFITRMPKGYDTEILEDGGNLSNGQKQLLCIARIMLMNPPILILDEATSSIDTRTEMKVQDAFARLMKGKTSFIVAHRLSTIQSADVILVMKDGNVIEQGTHAELLKEKGFYYELYQSQWA